MKKRLTWCLKFLLLCLCIAYGYVDGVLRGYSNGRKDEYKAQFYDKLLQVYDAYVLRQFVDSNNIEIPRKVLKESSITVRASVVLDYYSKYKDEYDKGNWCVDRSKSDFTDLTDIRKHEWSTIEQKEAFSDKIEYVKSLTQDRCVWLPLSAVKEIVDEM